MSLIDLSLEELWELFPISLVEPNYKYVLYYEEEEKCLKKILPEATINHIGSTALKINTKPIVDILVEHPDLLYAKKKLLENGYLLMNCTSDKISFNKGYLETGYAEKVYHIHIRRVGDHPEIIFKNYLLQHPNYMLEYEKLKKILIKKYPKNRDLYTEGKTNFVNNILRLAKGEIF